MAISSLLQQLDSFSQDVCPSAAQLIKGKSRRKPRSHSELEEGGNKEARSHVPCGKIPRSQLIRSLLACDFVHAVSAFLKPGHLWSVQKLHIGCRNDGLKVLVMRCVGRHPALPSDTYMRPCKEGTGDNSQLLGLICRPWTCPGASKGSSFRLVWG